MGYSFYRILVLIPEDHPLNFSDLASLLTSRFSDIAETTVQVREPDQIAIAHDRWRLRIHWEDGPHVVEEAKGIAMNFVADHSDRELIATCSRRVSTAGDPDPEMRYFNDYVFALEVLESLEGVFIFDPDEGAVRATS